MEQLSGRITACLLVKRETIFGIQTTSPNELFALSTMGGSTGLLIESVRMVMNDAVAADWFLRRGLLLWLG